MRRITLSLVLAFLLLSPVLGVSASSGCAGHEGSCLSGTEETPAPKGDASTSNEGRSPVLERAAAPSESGGRLIEAHPASAPVEKSFELANPRPEPLRELSIAAVSTPLYLDNCSFLC